MAALASDAVLIWNCRQRPMCRRPPRTLLLLARYMHWRFAQQHWMLLTRCRFPLADCSVASMLSTVGTWCDAYQENLHTGKGMWTDVGTASATSNTHDKDCKRHECSHVLSKVCYTWVTCFSRHRPWSSDQPHSPWSGGWSICRYFLHTIRKSFLYHAQRACLNELAYCPHQL